MLKGAKCKSTLLLVMRLWGYKQVENIVKNRCQGGHTSKMPKKQSVMIRDTRRHVQGWSVPGLTQVHLQINLNRVCGLDKATGQMGSTVGQPLQTHCGMGG